MAEIASAEPEKRRRATPGTCSSILFLVYVLNFVDRQIISILAEDIKRDLGLKDEDLGFLYGTAFGVFYSLFGIPLGRLADNWHRVRLMTIGLTLWSTMTALSGLSRTGGHLAAARIGVGIGEATASPSAYSLISDYFPKRLRATALVDLFGRALCRRRLFAVHRRADRAGLEPGLSRRRAARAGRLAGGVHGGRHAGAAARALDRDAARADPRRGRGTARAGASIRRRSARSAASWSRSCRR